MAVFAGFLAGGWLDFGVTYVLQERIVADMLWVCLAFGLIMIASAGGP